MLITPDHKVSEAAFGKKVFSKVSEVSEGGYALDTTGLTEGSILPAGTAMVVDRANRAARIATSELDTAQGMTKNDVRVSPGEPVSLVYSGVAYADRVPADTLTRSSQLSKITFI